MVELLRSVDPQAELWKERLLSRTVAREKQAPTRGVVDADREHAVEPLDDAVTPRAIALDDHLRVGARAELVAEPLELTTHLVVVVDLAVEHDHEVAVGAVHRLGTGRAQIEDGEAPVQERERSVGVAALGVGTAVRDRP